jgi:hypothetical protein
MAQAIFPPQLDGVAAAASGSNPENTAFSQRWQKSGREQRLNGDLSLHTDAMAHPPPEQFTRRILGAMSRLIVRCQLQACLGLVVALGIAATRTEKLIAEMQSSLPHLAVITLSPPDHAVPEPFDPARVPPSGGMAARLLAGISVKPA